jgi:hypothetical protein
MNNNEEIIITFLSEPDWLDKQNNLVKKLRISNARFGLMISFILIIIAAAALLYWKYGGSKKAVLFLIVGIILILVSLYHIYKNITRILNASQITYYNNIDQLCKDFYSKVFESGEDAQAAFINYALQCIPAPICDTYAINANDYLSWGSLVKRWTAYKKWNAEAMVTFKVDQLPRTDPNIVDVCIHLRWFKEKVQNEILFSNVAFHFSEYWFLATPEPILKRT